MKLEPLAHEICRKKVKMIITEDQLSRLTNNVIKVNEKATIKKVKFAKY